jgi:hypothetical protein
MVLIKQLINYEIKIAERRKTLFAILTDHTFGAKKPKFYHGCFSLQNLVSF